MNGQTDIDADVRRVRACLATLQHIPAETILTFGGQDEGYHPTLEMAYAALGRIETEVDALSQELEYQHKRLDAARDAALAKAIQESE